MNFEILTDKENDVIKKRFIDKRTLQSIGDDYGLTRERVRQVQDTAIEKLKRTKNVNGLKDILKDIEDRIIKDKIIFQNKLEPSELLAINVSDKAYYLGNTKYYKKVWVHKEIKSKMIHEACKRAYKILDQNKKPMFFDNDLFNLCAKIDKRIIKTPKGFALSEWRWINPRSIDDYIEIVLADNILHIKDVHELVKGLRKKETSLNSVHNSLINNPNFVRVGNGLYKFKTPDTIVGDVADVIEVILSNGEMKKQDIINEVLKHRQVKAATIALNLQKDPRFKRVGRAVYALA